MYYWLDILCDHLHPVEKDGPKEVKGNAKLERTRAVVATAKGAHCSTPRPK